MAQDYQLAGETALIIGSSSGIGRATAIALAEEGASVALAARRKKRLNELADMLEDEHETETLSVQTDVTEEIQVEDLITSTVEAFDTLDHVIYSAGEGRSSPIEEMSTEEYQLMNGVFMDGAFFATRAAIPHLRKSGGSLVFIGSYAAHYPYPSNPVYGAAKWWTRGFAKSISGDLGADDISVTVVNPSETRTEWGDEYTTAFKEQYQEDEALDPEDVADAVTFAVSQESPSSVTELDMYRRDRLIEF